MWVKQEGRWLIAVQNIRDTPGWERQTKSAVAEHALAWEHNINWKSAKVLDTAAGLVQRRVKESLHIQIMAKTRPLLNKDKGLKIQQVWLGKV